MNRLPKGKRAQILSLLLEGMSMRSASRIAGVSTNTVTKLLVDAGRACAVYHDVTVRNVTGGKIECDEIWSFCYAKDRNVSTAKAAPQDAGDVWTWTAIDRDTKLLVSCMVGDRSADMALEFMTDVRYRLANRVQLFTDGLSAYLGAVETAFGDDVDYGQLVKTYGLGGTVMTGVQKQKVIGNPSRRSMSTSHVERHNLTMRMVMRRYTRMTNAFSKKLENHIHMCSLYAVWYNFVRPHMSLGGRTPAMAAGLASTAHDMEWIIDLIADQA